MANAGRVLLRIPRPDDWHLHVRDGAGMMSLMASAPRTMARAIIMPNLKPPVRTTAEALAYRARIIAALPAGSDFEPLMTLYLTDNTSAEEISAARAAGVAAVKYYPAGATTNSDAGVTDVMRTLPALQRMEEVGMPLLVHGEVTQHSVDVFEREPVFLRDVLAPLVQRCPGLKVVLEHITTKEAVAFVNEGGDNIAATITAHHLMYNRNGARPPPTHTLRRAAGPRWPPRSPPAPSSLSPLPLASRPSHTRAPPFSPACAALFEGGLRPHRYCLPILKHESDRQALVGAIASGSPKFFLGTDSAPHTAAAKECACGAAGMFTAHAALELYASIFAEAGCLQHLQAFACENGPRFYGLPPNAQRLPGSAVEIREEEWTVPEAYAFGDSAVVPVMAGQVMRLRAHVVSSEK